MSKTFLELVNEAIDESKVSLDALDSSNFATPPRTVMYNRFKRWINNAYKELFMARNEWHFRQERASLLVWPRLHLSGLSTIPAVGDVLTGDSSGVQFTIKTVYTFEDVEQDATIERTFGVQFSTNSDPTNLIMRETFTCDPVAPGANYAAGYLKGFGFYDFKSVVTGLHEIDTSTVRVYNAAGSTVQNLPNEGRPVIYVDSIDPNETFGDYPLYMAETDQGTYDFYPKLVDQVQLTFDYARKIPQMVAYNETPEALPEEYHDYLIWKAVEEYADFENNPRLFARARKHTTDYWNWLDRDQKQEVKFQESKF